MEINPFPHKNQKPTENEIKLTVGENYRLWNEIREFVYQQYPDATEEWNFPGKKYGWSFRIKDKKRAIIYFLPFAGFFKVFVFGQKATDSVYSSPVNEKIKNELKNARVYAEGRGIRIDVKDATVKEDIKKLIEIKLKF